MSEKLECGYNGIMGIIKEIIPWSLSYWFIIPLAVIVYFLFGISVAVTIIILVIFRYFSKKYYVECPSCKKILRTK